MAHVSQDGARLIGEGADQRRKEETMRNLKALGLALVAALAISAMAASMAQATNPGTITGTEGPGNTTLHGTQLATGNSFTLTGPESPAELECSGGTFDQIGAGIPAGGAVSEVSFTKTSSGCVSRNPTGFMTVTHNECTHRFYHATTIAGTNNYSVTSELKCPPGKGIEVHVYLFSNHTFQTCTITATPQTFTNSNLTLTHEGAGNTTDLRLHGTISGINYHVNSGCSHNTGLTTDGVFHTNVTVTGKAHAGAHTAIHIGGP